jgi:hypothetical protein
MQSDRPGILMRQRLLQLLTAHGEQEVHRGTLLNANPNPNPDPDPDESEAAPTTDAPAYRSNSAHSGRWSDAAQPPSTQTRRRRGT